MKAFSRFRVPIELSVPFVPMGVKLDVGLGILGGLGVAVQEENDKERSFKVQIDGTSVAIYTRGQLVDAVWYDDPLGRWSAQGRMKKIELHLARYGSLSGWSVWSENGWMRYWKHETATVRMVYGIHMDVIRFNHGHPSNV